MFTPTQRCDVRVDLVAAARTDPRITGAAFVGSVAANTEDRWSDIDLALRLAPTLTPGDVADSWTSALYSRHSAVTHFDLWSGPTLFRVFLLATSLQIDLSFWPDGEFASTGGPFKLLFGDAAEPTPSAGQRPPTRDIGMAWLHALHVRSSIARSRHLQSLSMLNGMREHVISLACLRHGLIPDQGRGVDQLPDPITQDLGETIVRGLDTTELVRAFTALTDLFIAELDAVDRVEADRLRAVLVDLVATSDPRAAQPLDSAPDAVRASPATDGTGS